MTENQKQDVKKIKVKRRVCCACKKTKKIVNIGGPPLCKDCYPLACNWSEAYEKHQKFMMSLGGIEPVIIDIGADNDLSYWLEEIAKYHAEMKMRLKQSEICLINICTMIRSEPGNKLPHWIVDGVCMKKDDVICNLGYACDGCPYNYREGDCSKGICPIKNGISLRGTKNICDNCHHN
jgi:hypothetical protein